VIDAPDTETPPAPTPRRPSLLPWLLLVLLLGLGGWRGWEWWQAQQAESRAAASASEHRVLALEERLAALRRDQRSQAARLQQADATNRILRDELLGISQRATLLEDSVARLADTERNGARALRLDEVELLLAMAMQRLQLAADLEGTRRAYALAADVLSGIEDPRYLDLRQALAQERAALAAVEVDPARTASQRLDAFEAGLEQLPATATAGGDPRAPWWRRLLSRFIEVRPSAGTRLQAPADRRAARDALRIELTIARAALERRDAEAWRPALARAGAWLPRLWPASAEGRKSTRLNPRSRS
jgi:uroporphyrin-3 C-methyltransferase